ENGRRLCTLQQMEEALSSSPVGFGLPRNSPLAELINRRIDSFREAYLINKLIKEGYPPEISKENYACMYPSTFASSSEPQVFRLQQMGGIFVMWFVGLVLACFIFLGELINYSYAGNHVT
ncbi:unnamed protein product, partial [Meganyctiphanes norvegica]